MIETLEIKKEGRGIYVFGATWCAECREVVNKIEALEAKFKNKYQVYHIDVDKAEPALLDEYKINEMPVVLVLRNGKEVVRLFNDGGVDIIFVIGSLWAMEEGKNENNI